MQNIDFINRFVAFKYRIFILPIITLFIVVILSVTLGKFMVEKIFESRDELSALSQKNKMLEGKDLLLASANKAELTSDAKAAVLGIPSQTPSLPVLATLRRIAYERGINISDFQIVEKSDPKSNVKSLEIQTTLYGGLSAVVGLINELKNYSPLMKVIGTEISSNNGLALAQVRISTSWAPLPQSLGKAQDKLEPVTDAENELLSQLKELKSASGGTILPSAPAGRTNPFE